MWGPMPRSNAPEIGDSPPIHRDGKGVDKRWKSAIKMSPIFDLMRNADIEATNDSPR